MAVVKVDEELCTACGVCSDLCPDLFDLDDVATVKVADVEGELLDCAKEAAESCPTEAILIEE
jgi:ferredoxin